MMSDLLAEAEFHYEIPSRGCNVCGPNAPWPCLAARLTAALRSVEQRLAEVERERDAWRRSRDRAIEDAYQLHLLVVEAVSQRDAAEAARRYLLERAQ